MYTWDKENDFFSDQRYLNCNIYANHYKIKTYLLILLRLVGVGFKLFNIKKCIVLVISGISHKFLVSDN